MKANPLILCALLAFSASVKAQMISRQPAGQSVSLGADVSFAVNASGKAALQYQWALNQLPVKDATNRTLLITNVTLANGGRYVVTVTDSAVKKREASEWLGDG
ncbi:MAG TPA: immunoglobulin domain-containing protein [Verrucomicrobiae bacterium]|nr:immunoglobulin domain-containing protein [Verrucomicrobiae bacterium]